MLFQSAEKTFFFVHAERCLAEHGENFNQNRNFSDSFGSGGNRVEEVDFY